jgi:hypothetical protein
VQGFFFAGHFLSGVLFAWHGSACVSQSWKIIRPWSVTRPLERRVGERPLHRYPHIHHSIPCQNSNKKKKLAHMDRGATASYAHDVTRMFGKVAVLIAAPRVGACGQTITWQLEFWPCGIPTGSCRPAFRAIQENMPRILRLDRNRRDPTHLGCGP